MIITLLLPRQVIHCLKLFLLTICIGISAPAQPPPGNNLDSVRHIVNTSRDVKARLDAGRLLIIRLFNRQQFDSVDFYRNLLYPEARRTNHTKFLLAAQYQMACKLQNAGKFDSAYRIIGQSQQLAAAAKDTTQLCQLLDFLASSYLNQDNMDAVRNIYNQSLAFKGHVIGDRNIVRVACMLANLLQSNELDDSAIALLKQVEPLSDRGPEQFKIELVYMLGGLFSKKGDFKVALENLNTALAFYEKEGMEKAAASVKVEIGRMYVRQNQPKLALPLFHAALDYGTRNNDYETLRGTLRELSSALADLEQWQEAYKYLNQSWKLEDSSHTSENKTAIASFQTRMESTLKEKENQVLSLQLENRKAIIARQRWMIGSAIGLLLLSGLGYWLYLRYRRRRWQQEMEQKKAESELLNLKSQFDPHFIHNFFAFLVKQVKEGAREKSVSLLNDCSRYFRNILEQNRENIISLEEEIEGLTRYLNLQQQIHEGKFEYSIEADEKLDTFGIELPAFLFQPFVENALKHGFGNIDYKGKLEIKFSADDHYLEGIVADNGPGPGTSNANAPEHKSVGTQLTHERLDLFTKLKKLGKGLIESGSRKEGQGYFVRVKLPLA